MILPTQSSCVPVRQSLGLGCLGWQRLAQRGSAHPPSAPSQPPSTPGYPGGGDEQEVSGWQPTAAQTDFFFKTPGGQAEKGALIQGGGEARYQYARETRRMVLQFLETAALGGRQDEMPQITYSGILKDESKPTNNNKNTLEETLKGTWLPWLEAPENKFIESQRGSKVPQPQGRMGSPGGGGSDHPPTSKRKGAWKIFGSVDG